MIKPASKAKTHELTKSVEPNKARDIIVRDTIVNVRVKVGRGAAATEFEYPSRVLGIYEKYYNNWARCLRSYGLGMIRKRRRRNTNWAFACWIKMPLTSVPMFPCTMPILQKKNVYQTIEDSQIVSIVGQLFDPSEVAEAPGPPLGIDGVEVVEELAVR